MVFEITPDELAAGDAYEVSHDKRVNVLLASGWTPGSMSRLRARPETIASWLFLGFGVMVAPSETEHGFKK